MNKPFIKDDPDSEHQANATPAPNLPIGRNYITPQGLKNLQDEFHSLKTEERPKICAIVSWAAENGDRSENADYHYGKKRLREIDKRLGFLSKRIDLAEVVDPLLIKDKSRVYFGATVSILDEDDSKKTYTIVGADEIDIDNGRISWVSPIARAMLKAQIGDVVSFESPRGKREIEIIDISYL
jgi:transcription elongation factor GreB